MNEKQENQPSLMDGVHELEERFHNSREQLYALNVQAVKTIQEHPAAAIVGAFAVGWIIGKIAQKRWLV